MLNEMTIEEIIIMFLKRWWILLVGLILGGAIAFVYTEFFVNPVYTSRGTLYVHNKNNSSVTSNSSTNLNDLNVAMKLIDTYKVILKSDRFLSMVRQQARVNYSLAEMRQIINYQGVQNTEVLEVTATCKKPSEAQLIVQTILINAKDEIIRVAEVGNVKIVDDATIPTLPSSPNKKLNTALGFLLGLVLAVVVVILIELMDGTIKDEEDLSRNYDIPIVGCIPNLEEILSTKPTYYAYAYKTISERAEEIAK